MKNAGMSENPKKKNTKAEVNGVAKRPKRSKAWVVAVAVIVLIALVIAAVTLSKRSASGDSETRSAEESIMTDRTEAEASPEQTTVEPELQKTEQELLNDIKAFADKNIVEYECDDFNGDGSKEMFAIVGDGYAGSAMVFADHKGCGYVSDDLGLSGDNDDCLSVETVNGRAFLLFNTTMGNASRCGILSVFDDGYRVLTLNISVSQGDGFLAENGRLTKFDDYTLCVTVDRYNSTTFGDDRTGPGHTWIPYYFYWDENSAAFREYGGIDVTEESFANVKGSADILDFISGNGYEIREIFYRENGVVNLNVYKDGFDDPSARENYIITLLYDGRKQCFVTVDKERFSVVPDMPEGEVLLIPGLCEKQISTSADHPEKFPDLKEWYLNDADV